MLSVNTPRFDHLAATALQNIGTIRFYSRWQQIPPPMKGGPVDGEKYWQWDGQICARYGTDWAMTTFRRQAAISKDESPWCASPMSGQLLLTEMAQGLAFLAQQLCEEAGAKPFLDEAQVAMTRIKGLYNFYEDTPKPHPD